MLGKKVWRLINRPDSLIARVYKAKYYPFSSIWEADASNQSSYTWRSILWGRNLVAARVRWRVGDGSSIMIYNSRRLPTPWDFKISSPHYLPHQARVSELLDERGQWKESLVRSAFLPFEADIILNLPRPLFRSASPSYNGVSGWWNSLWSSELPSKIKIFWWRLVRDFLPTTWNLNAHHIPAIQKCALCRYGGETC
ncbi:hypothetical protein UlMin_025818 [Ulmus minor]